MVQWNYELSDKKRKFIKIDEEPRVVYPAPDALGHQFTVTGSRYDLVAKFAPSWLANVVAEAAGSGGKIPLYLVRIGQAGKHNFWTVPQGVTSPEQLLSLSRIQAAEAKERQLQEAAAHQALKLAESERRDASLRDQAVNLAKAAGYEVTLVPSSGRVVIGVNAQGWEFILGLSPAMVRGWMLDARPSPKNDWLPGILAGRLELGALEEREIQKVYAKVLKAAEPVADEPVIEHSPFAALGGLLKKGK